MSNRLFSFSQGVSVLPNINFNICSGMKSQRKGFQLFADLLSWMTENLWLAPYFLLLTMTDVLGGSVCPVCPPWEFSIFCILYLSSDLSYFCSHFVTPWLCFWICPVIFLNKFSYIHKNTGFRTKRTEFFCLFLIEG